jgi:F-type H+-transporting ATPase subunit gamma
VLSQIRGQESTVNIVAVGRKTREFWGRHKFSVAQTHEKVGFPITWDESERIGRDLASLHSFMKLYRVRLAYQRFVSAGVSRPVIVPWLPFQQPEADKTSAVELRCEPSVAAVLDLILPRALTAQLHRALLEAQASEQGARMVAMDNATTNAEELTGDLTLLANKLRQTGITKELLEITTGAEALNA